MNVFIVYTHPSKKSFTFQIFKSLVKGLKISNHNIEISDLYEMNFRTDMSEEEYRREGSANTQIKIPNDILNEHEKIENTDCIIFIYPVWWSDCPAKLKGWFDRVYSVGFAYGYSNENSNIKKMKQVKLGLSICTAGHPIEFLEEIGISESMRNIMVDDRLGERFERKQLIILGGTLEIEKVRDQHIKKAFNIGKNIKEYYEEYN